MFFDYHSIALPVNVSDVFGNHLIAGRWIQADCNRFNCPVGKFNTDVVGGAFDEATCCQACNSHEGRRRDAALPCPNGCQAGVDNNNRRRDNGWCQQAVQYFLHAFAPEAQLPQPKSIVECPFGSLLLSKKSLALHLSTPFSKMLPGAAWVCVCTVAHLCKERIRFFW